MKFFCSLLFIISSTIFGQLPEPLLSKGAYSVQIGDEFDTFIDGNKVYILNNNSIIISDLSNKSISDTIKINTELDSYNSVKVSKLGNIYVHNHNQRYLVSNNTLVLAEDSDKEEFANQTNEIVDENFSEEESGIISDFFNNYEYYGSYDPNVMGSFKQSVYKLGETKLFFCQELTLGGNNNQFLFKINEYNVAELLYTAHHYEYSSDTEFLILDDILYLVDSTFFNPQDHLSRIEGNISTNFTLSNSFIEPSKENSIYSVEDNKIKTLNSSYKIAVHNLMGQEVKNENLSAQKIYMLKITNTISNMLKKSLFNNIIV